MIEPFKHLFGDDKKTKAFIGKVLDTRNYLTHYDKKLSKSAATSLHLYELNLKLECLFQLHLLRLVGLSPERIDALAMESDSLRSKLEYSAPSKS